MALLAVPFLLLALFLLLVSLLVTTTAFSSIGSPINPEKTPLVAGGVFEDRFSERFLAPSVNRNSWRNQCGDSELLASSVTFFYDYLLACVPDPLSGSTHHPVVYAYL